MMKTINEHIANLTAQFRTMSPQARAAWIRKAKAYIEANPSMADASTFWRGLSARQVIAAK
jgi:hypothetical protein